MNRRSAITTLTAMLWLTPLLGGCQVTGPRVPAGWVEAPSFTLFSGQSLATHRTPLMQVIICYGPLLQTHAAIRLTNVSGRVVYWDPGGKFGRDDPRYFRLRDIVTDPAPSIDELWLYRRYEADNEAMAVFEWELDAPEAQRLQNVLLDGAANPKHRGAFNPDFLAARCAAGVSRYIKQYCAHRIDIPKTTMYPHSLSRQLWGQNPDRVLIYRQGVRPVTLVPAQTLTAQTGTFMGQ